MARLCLVALLCVGVLCGLVAGQNPGNEPSTTAKGTPNPGGPTNTNQQRSGSTTAATTEPVAEPEAEPEPEPESEPEAEPSPSSNKPKASSSNQNNKDSGAAMVKSLSLPSLMVGVVLAKLYAH